MWLAFSLEQIGLFNIKGSKCFGVPAENMGFDFYKKLSCCNRAIDEESFIANHSSLQQQAGIKI